MGGGDFTASMKAVSPNDVGDAVAVKISCSSGSRFSVQINLDSTVASFKALLARSCGIPADQQRLIYKGRILKDDQTLQSYGLEADHTVHLVRRFAPPTTNAAGSISSGISNTSQTNTMAVSSDDAGALGAGGAGLGASLLPELGLGGLGGSAGLFGAGLPNFDQVQQQSAQNPNIMREVMDRSAFQNLLRNTEIFENLIMNNPQTRDIIDRNPELAHILNDPITVHQILEVARNPELMREMLRNTNRAMSNVESSPEEFNMLCHMCETVREPLLNTTTMAGITGNGSANPFATLLGTQGGSPARNGSTNQSTSASGTTPSSPAPNTNPLPNPWSSSAAGGAQTNTTRSDSSVHARPQAPADLGGLGPAFEGLFGAMQDGNSLNHLMQNPAISQIMQTLQSNPQLMNQVLDLSSQVQSFVSPNSQLTETMQNSQFLRQLTSPEILQELSTLQQSFLPQLSRPLSTQELAQTGGGVGTLSNMDLESLMTMFGGLGTGSLAVPNRSDVPPEQLYASQLLRLQEMGFIDTRDNIQALIATGGNVHAAVEQLLGNPGQ